MEHDLYTRAAVQLAEADAFILAAVLAMKRGLDLHRSASTLLRAACHPQGAPDCTAPAASAVAAPGTALLPQPGFVRRFGRSPMELLARPEVVMLTLTCREQQVLLLVSQGLANRGIARSLGIAEKTVKNHLAAVFAKLGVSDRTQAALYAVQTGLAEPVLAAP